MFSIHKEATLYNLLVLFMLYTNIILTFAVIYLILDYTKLGPVVDHYMKDVSNHTFGDILYRSLYFSTSTLLSVGYGDVTPYGWSRAAAMLESIIGGILPAALVIRFMVMPLRHADRWGRLPKDD
jgi:potassium channel LctB